MIPDKTVGRLSLYRQLLAKFQEEGRPNVFSHELADMARVTAAQVRRDLMATGYSGSPTRGYGVGELLRSIGDLLDVPECTKIGLVGVGNLGKAIMAYFLRYRPSFPLVAAFDKDPRKVNRVTHGCRCYPLEQITPIIQVEGIRVAIITVPADAAGGVADILVRAGVVGLLNFAPVRLRVPPHVHVENADITIALEKVVFFARPCRGKKKG